MKKLIFLWVEYVTTTLATTHPTLLDVMKAMNPGGGIDDVAEVLNQTNEMLDDAVMVEGNLPTGHRSTIRAGLPAPTWRKLYGGVQPSKGRTVQVTDDCGMLEAYAEIDKALADLNGNTMEFRAIEDSAHIEGISQEAASTLIYGNSASEPEAFTGLAPRFNSLSAENADNIIKSGTTPDKSIWLMVWGPTTCHMIYPKGSMAGLQVTDKGQVTIENIDGSGGRMEAYRTHYRWDLGVAVRDWRYIVRIQIDESELTKSASSGPDLIDLLQQAVDLVPNINAGRAVFYANRTVRGFLRRQIMNKTASSTLTMETIERPNGQEVKVPMVDGIPVRRLDVLATTETEIS